MRRLKPSRDVQPVTEFRAHAAEFIEQVRNTGEPVILTQHRQSAAALISVARPLSVRREGRSRDPGPGARR
jgi:prevent-host-death family protein